MESAALKHADLSERIIGVFYDVYSEFGYGLVESVYEESLVIALRGAGLNGKTGLHSDVVSTA